MTNQRTEYSCRGSLTQKLAAYYDSPDLADVTIKVGRRSFSAHRLVLGSRSDVLARMMEEIPGDILELNANATKKEATVFGKVLNFLYTGQINFTTDNVKMVIGLANQFSLEALSRLAQNWLGDTIERGSVVSALTWFKDAGDRNLASLRNRCLRILMLYFEYIPEASWLDLSVDNLVSILDQDDLVAENEEAVIKRVDSWLAAKGNYEDNESLRIQYGLLASKIRLPFVETSKLVTMRETSLIVKYIANSSPSLLTDALTYRSLCAELTPRGHETDCGENCSNPGCRLLKGVIMLPRLYLHFQSPGEGATSDVHRRSSEATTHFKRVQIASYSRPDINCFVRERNGCWKSVNRHFDMDVSAKQHEFGPSKSWSIEYKLTPEYHHRRMNGSYRVVIVARPLDKDSEFYLLDNPAVSTKTDTISSSGGVHPESFTLCTPPMFAGRKPDTLEIAAAAYFIKNTTD